jgi:hypothetical protein
MRTTKTKVTFCHSFILNRSVGELPAGDYNIEIDEEEILTSGRTGYRRTAVYFFVEKDTSTRMLSVEPADFESALSREEEKRAGLLPAESGRTTPTDRASQ